MCLQGLHDWTIDKHANKKGPGFHGITEPIATKDFIWLKHAAFSSSQGFNKHKKRINHKHLYNWHIDIDM